MTVYFYIQADDRVKIGYTSSPSSSKRKRELQTGSGFPLILAGELPDGTPIDEVRLHFHFSQYNIPGAGREWFWLVPPIQKYINTFAIMPIEESIDLCAESKEEVSSGKRWEAISFLKELFTQGGPAILGNTVKGKAIDRGISNGTLYDAQKRLNIAIKQDPDEVNPVGKPYLWFPPEEWPI